MVEQAQAIICRIPIAERLSVEIGPSESTLVPGDHPVVRGQRLDLGGKHLLIHEESVGEYHHGAVTTGVLEVDALAIDVGVRHGRNVPDGPTWADAERSSVRRGHDTRFRDLRSNGLGGCAGLRIHRCHVPSCRRRAGPAVDPDRGGDDRRGAASTPGWPRACSPAYVDKEVRGQGIASFSQSIALGHAEGLIGDETAGVRQGQRPQARLRDRRRRRPPVRVLRAAHGLRPLPAAAPDDAGWSIETPQYFLLRVACGLSQHAGRGDRASTG